MTAPIMRDGREFRSGVGWLRHLRVMGLMALVAWGGVLGQGEGDDDRRGLQDFSLSITPASGNVVQGASRTYSVEASIDSDGFDDEISLTISGLGTGVTGTFAGSVSSAGTSTTLTVSATTTAALATSNFTVTGTADNGLTRTVSGSVTVKARQPTSFSISPSEVGIGECYTISAGNAANMTLDLQYSKDKGETQTVTGWPTLDEDGEAQACPTLESQVGSYRFTAYRNTQASTWLTSNETLVVVKRDFSVAVSPASRNVYRVGTGTYTVTVNSINSFSSPVTLSVSGLPAGVTGAFSTNPVTPAGTSTLTLTAGAAATLGEDEFTVTGTGGSLTRTGTAEVVVPHFMLSVSPDTGNLDRGSSRTYTVEVTPQNGFSMPVALSVSGLGTGLTGSFSRNQVMPPNWMSTLTIDADCSAATTADEFTVTGSGGGYTATDTDEVSPRRFTVAVTPATADLQRGSSVQYQISVTRDEGFSSNITLSVSSLPSGVTGKFSTNPTGSASRLTLTATSTAALGKDEFTVTGTAHGCTAAAMADVVVTDPPRFNVTMTPETGNVDRGSSRTYTVTVKPDSGFTSDVTLSVSGLGTGLTGRFSRNPVTSSDWTSTLTVTAGCNATRGRDSFKVTGTGGGASASDTDTVVVKGFDVAVTPETANLQRRNSVDYQVTVTRDSGFSSNVTLSVSSLPAGVTGSFSTNPTGDTSTLTLTATASATLGPDSFTVTGTAHGCTDTDTDEVVVLAAPSFSVSTTPETANLQQGNSVQYTVTVSPETGFTSDVTLSVSNLPAGVTGVFSPNPVNAASAPPWTSILTLTASPDAAAGTANFTVTGTAGDRSASDTDTVVVAESQPAGSFTLSVSPSSRDVTKGDWGSYTVSVNRTGGFSAPVTLSVSRLSNRNAPSFSVNPVPDSTDSSRLTIVVGPSASTGNDDFTITGTAGTLTRSATATVSVRNPGNANFSLTVSPTRRRIAPGSSKTYRVRVPPVRGRTATVNLSVRDLGGGFTSQFSPASIRLGGTSTLTVTAPADAAPREETFIVQGRIPLAGQSVRRAIAAVAEVPPPDPDFELSLSPPASRSITRDQSLAYTLTVTRMHSLASPIDLRIDGLESDSGLTPSFSDSQLTGSETTSILTLSAGSNAAARTDQFKIVATSVSGGQTITHSVNESVTVTGPDFWLGASPSSASVDRGAFGIYRVMVNRINGFSSPVRLSLSGLTAGLTGAFSEELPPANSTTTSNPTFMVNTGTTNVYLKIRTAVDVALGSYTLTITGTAGNLTRTTQAAVEMTSPGFSLSALPTIGGLMRPAFLPPFRQYNVTVTPLAGFSSSVSLSVSGLPTELTGTFSPEMVSTNTGSDSDRTSTLTLTGTSSVPLGSHEFTITGTGGGVTRTIQATVVVVMPTCDCATRR